MQTLTCIRSLNYHYRMNAPAPDISLPAQFYSIEQSINQLLTLVDRLNRENRELKQREKVLIEECTRLRQCNTNASLQLQAIIDRLKQSVQET